MKSSDTIPAQPGFFVLTPVFSGHEFETVTSFKTRPIIGWRIEPDDVCIPLVANELSSFYVILYPGIDGTPRYETSTLEELMHINYVLPWMKSQNTRQQSLQQSPENLIDDLEKPLGTAVACGRNVENESDVFPDFCRCDFGTHEEGVALARRIAACLNALSDFTTSQIENGLMVGFAPEYESAIDAELITVLTRNPGSGAYGDLVNKQTDFVTIDMLCKALGADSVQASAGMQSDIRAWLQFEGWAYTKKQVNGVRRPGWSRPSGWKKAEGGAA